MTETLPQTDTRLSPETDAALDLLAKRYKAADGLGMQVLNMLGGQAEDLIGRLPSSVRANLDRATQRALEVAFDAAATSRGRFADRPDWLNRVVTSTMGAAGGAGGLPTALAELPVTATVLLRAIQGIAAEEGFDPSDAQVRAQCLQIFGAAGPLEHDDGADLAFLSTRIALSGPAVHGIIARVAPRLAGVMGQKLAAQTVPLIGAAAGAATNWAYTSYYQEMARVYFGLRRLAREGDTDVETLLREFRLRVTPPRMVR